MFDNLRRRRRRKSLSMRRARTRRASGLRISQFGPLLKIAGIAAAAIAFILIIIFVIVPLFKGSSSSGKNTPTPAATHSPTATPIAKADMSEGAKELDIAYQSINDPYVYGSEVVFTTGVKTEASPELKVIAVHNAETGETAELKGVQKKNNSLLEPKMNDKYIVYLDCKQEYGGAVCGYDRAKSEAFVMRDYYYGKPKVTLAGDYAVWMQQVSKGTDRLYLYHMPTRESVEIEIFVNTDFSQSAPYISKDALVFVEPKDENKMTTQDTSSASTEAQICVMPLKEGGAAQSIYYLPGIFAYNPMIDGDNLVFLDGTGDKTNHLMLCKKEGSTYSTPVAIAEGVLNYAVGDGYVVYTKDNAVYIYYFKDASTGRLSSSTTRAVLSNANGKDIVWYDITGGFTSNVIMHIQVP